MAKPEAHGKDHESAIALMQQGRWCDAEKRLNAAIERNPHDARTLRLLGTLCHITQRGDEALACLERALELEPTNISTLLNLGSVYLKIDRHSAAERCFAQVIEIDPTSADGHFNLGLAMQHAGRFDEAAQHYTSALDRDPQALDAAVNLAAVHLLRGHHATCIADVEQILRRDAAHLQARVLLLKALLALSRLADAEHALQQTPVAIAEHRELRAIEGKLHLLNGRLEEAALAYRLARDLGDTTTPTGLELTRCLLDSGDAAGAIEVLHTIIERDPTIAEHHALLGLALRDAGNNEAALAAYEQALRLQPQAAHFVTAKANLLFELNRHEQAEQALDAAIELAPAIVSPHLLRVERLIADADLVRALTVCEQYLQGVGAECNMLAAKSFLLHAMGRSEQAAALVDFEGLISTTVVKQPDGFASLRDFNTALCAHILGHPSLSRANAASKATQHGRQSGNLLFGDCGPFEAFEQLLWSGAKDYVQTLVRDPGHPFRAKPPALDAVYAWAVVLERAGYQSPHIHPTAWLSGVYYPKVPAIVSQGNDEQGWIEFGAPPPELALSPVAPIRRIKPEEGLLVLFPSYFYHRTLAYDSDEARISIAFDFSPRRQVKT
jgi:uncharacterized protein (TIGR02466 family)